MIQLLQRYRELTKKQIDLLKMQDIDNIVQLLTEKDNLFSIIQKTSKQLIEYRTAEEIESQKKIVEEILTLNEEALRLMSNERTRISDDLHRIQQGHQIQHVYSSGITVEPYFLDQNK